MLALLLSIAMATYQAQEATHSTAGKLYLAGGGPTPTRLVEAFIEDCGGPKAMILVLPLASRNPESDTGSVDFLLEHGAENVLHWGIAEPTLQDLEHLAELLQQAAGIWMPGGDQSRILETLPAAFVAEHIRTRVEQGMHFYGTSAGAMVASRYAITGEIRTGVPTLADGFGLTEFVIDTHFGERSREMRLRKAIESSGAPLGIGISERSWVVLQSDRILYTSGRVTLLDQVPSPR